jgi:hypothetical protein
MFELYLKDTSSLTDQGFVSLAQLQLLERLELGYCSNLTRGGLKEMCSGLSQLNELGLEDVSQHTIDGKECLSELKRLRALSISGDLNIGFLRQLSQVTNLQIYFNDILTDTMLQPLEEMPQLESLYLDDCGLLSGIGLRYLHKLKNFESLNIEECPITDEGTSFLLDFASSMQIQQLSVSSTITLSNLTLKHLLSINKCHTGRYRTYVCFG